MHEKLCRVLDESLPALVSRKISAPLQCAVASAVLSSVNATIRGYSLPWLGLLRHLEFGYDYLADYLSYNVFFFNFTVLFFQFYSILFIFFSIRLS